MATTYQHCLEYMPVEGWGMRRKKWQGLKPQTIRNSKSSGFNPVPVRPVRSQTHSTLYSTQFISGKRMSITMSVMCGLQKKSGIVVFTQEFTVLGKWQAHHSHTGNDNNEVTFYICSGASNGVKFCHIKIMHILSKNSFLKITSKVITKN